MTCPREDALARLRLADRQDKVSEPESRLVTIGNLLLVDYNIIRYSSDCLAAQMTYLCLVLHAKLSERIR
jgi:hypothetical protein